MSDVQGRMEIAGLSSFFSEYLKMYHINTVKFMEQITQLSFQGFMNEKKITCEDVWSDSLPFDDEETKKKFCSSFKTQQEFNTKLYYNCEVDDSEFLKIITQN